MRIIEEEVYDEDYSVFYDRLKIRATNFMHGMSVVLAWAHLIAARTALDGPSQHKEWVVTTYGDSPIEGRDV